MCKRIMNRRWLYILLAVSTLLLASCAKELNDQMGWDPGFDTREFTAILTIKKTPGDTVYFQLDDTTTVYPRNYQDGFTRMERVYCGLSVLNRSTGRFRYTADVIWLESLEEGRVTSDSSVAGPDPLSVYEDWMTGVEDGYLTIHYATYWGKNPVRHIFTLVTGTNPDDPYEVVLRHDACGDAKEELGESIICFDLNGLPDTGGAYKTLTLNWTSGGAATSKKEFKFKTRK